MPQMFPLMWLILFLSTSLSMLLMSSIIFFSSKPTADSIKMKTSHPQQNWKWKTTYSRFLTQRQLYKFH